MVAARGVPVTEAHMTPPLPGPDASVSLLDYLLLLWASKWRLAALSVAGALLAFGGSFLMMPAYRATTVLLPISQDAGGGAVASLASRLGGLASLAGLSAGGGTGRDEAVAYLRSRKIITDFITDKNLLPVLFSEDWDATRRAWASSKPEDAPTIGDGYKRFDEQIRGISEDRRTGIVTFTITWYDRQKAAEWANELVARANQSLRERALAESRRTIGYLREEAGRADTVEVRQSIYRLMEEQFKAMAVASAREQYSFKVIDPAAVPDLRERVRPRRLLFAAIGLLMFFLAGAFAVWVRHDLRRRSVA
jgi:uncharacterized protein involved in exopolysaccharide biosynthesis